MKAKRFVLYTLYYDWRRGSWEKKPVLFTSDSFKKLLRQRKEMEEEHICDIIDLESDDFKEPYDEAT